MSVSTHFVGNQSGGRAALSGMLKLYPPIFPSPYASSVKTINLTQGKRAIIDDDDFERVSQFKWCAVRRFGLWYAERAHPYKNGGRRRASIPMHRFVMNAPPGVDVDHKNGNGLDNRKSELRFATQIQNCQNRGKRKILSSKYKGVDWVPRDNRWRSRITVHGKTKQIGYFTSEIEAAAQYDFAARLFFGEFARPNLPEGVQQL